MSVSLSKNQKVSLTKADGSALTRLRMDLGWDAATGGLFGGGGSIDLDASCIMLDASNREVDAVWYSHLRSNDGSVQHTGDNLTGAGDGDDESIMVDLNRVPAGVQTLFFTVNSFTGQTFKKVANAHCHLVDASGSSERDLGTFDLSAKGNNTAMVMAKVVRSGAGWTATMIGEPGDGRTYKDLVRLVQAL